MIEDYSLIKQLQNYQSSKDVSVCLGFANTEPIYMDLRKNPHMLIGGTTGSGKSSLLHSIIAQILLQNNSKLFILDPKGEYNQYSHISNKVYIETNLIKAASLFGYLIELMEHRFISFKNGKINCSPIIVIIDEFADLIMRSEGKAIYRRLCKLVQKCRAADIYIIIATQRPTNKIIDGNIKANFPARIACKVTSELESRIILSKSGAQELIACQEMIIKNYKYQNIKYRSLYSPPNKIIGFLNAKMETGL